MVARDSIYTRYINNKLLQLRYKCKSNCIQSVICLKSHFYFDSHNEEKLLFYLKPSILVNVVCAIYDLIYLHFARSQNFTLVQLPDYRFICRCYDIQYMLRSMTCNRCGHCPSSCPLENVNSILQNRKCLLIQFELKPGTM